MKYALKQVHIDNYKNLTNCCLDINGFAVLIGSNNSGKSNFIEIFRILDLIFYGGENGRKEAASIMASCNKPLLIKIVYEVYFDKKPVRAEYEIKIISKKNKNNIDININQESFYYKFISSTGSPKKLFNRDCKTLNYRTHKDRMKKRQISLDVPVFHVLRSLYPEVEQLPADYNYLIPLLYTISPAILSAHKMATDYDDDIQGLYERLYQLQEQNSSDFRSFKKHFLDILELEDIAFHQIEEPVKNKKEVINFCTVDEKDCSDLRFLNQMSDGTKILFLILYEIFIGSEDRRKTLLCIEEPEIGLHPKALSKLFQLFFDKVVPVQAIFTTHSPYLLNLTNPDKVFILEKSKKCLYTFKQASKIENLQKRLKSRYVDFGDLFVESFPVTVDTSLD